MLDLVAYVDGGSLGNPGPSGIGVVIEGCTSGTVRIARWIGRQDNNVAEYVALLGGPAVRPFAERQGSSRLFRFPGCGQANARRVRLPQFTPLLSPLDLLQADTLSEVFHHSRASGAQCGSQQLGQLRGPPSNAFLATNCVGRVSHSTSRAKPGGGL